MPDENKPVTIQVPPTMDEKNAQEIFLHGLRTMIQLYQGGVVVSFGIEGEGIHSYAFRNEEASAVIDFVTAIMQLDQNWKDKKPVIEQEGGKLLTELMKLKTPDSLVSDPTNSL